MRLLKCDTGKFSLTKDLHRDIPEYAILSHTWGSDEQEVTYRDLVNGTGEKKAGYEKLRFCAERSVRDGLLYFWIDTCCIDKSNNTELQEAINSMFRWYKTATRCYVYLADVSISDSTTQPINKDPLPQRTQKREASPSPNNIDSIKSIWEQPFRDSRWFKRGWTLQELLAPESVEFFSRDGLRLGDKMSLEQQIHEVTGIAVLALRGTALSKFEIEERFKWAEARQTTREEDGAYCLLGIFGVHMPLIYGEQRANSLRRLREEIEKCKEARTPPPPFALIPFRRDLDFVNRGDILDQIDKRCSEPAGRVALVGLGGIGKSQLAIEFSHQIKEKSAGTWVFWVHAGTQARVEEGFRAIADAIELPERKKLEADIPQLIYTWLSQERNGRWIMVLDSADDTDVFYGATTSSNSKMLASYLPQSPNGAILVTTRNKDLARRLTGNSGMIEVGAMAESEALSLLEKKLGTITESNAATGLIRTLEYVPLAINQAVGYIQARAPWSSFEKYLADFREGERKRTKLLGYDGGDLRRDGSASNAVLTTWQISFEHIYSKRRSAADLLSLMSFFNRQGIPQSLLKPTDLMSDLDKEDSDSDCSSGGLESDFEDDLAMLTDFCLISVNNDGTEFEMHGLVQLSTRKWLAAKGLREEVQERYLTRLGASFPLGDYENWEMCRKLFPHVETAIDYKPVEQHLEVMWATLLFHGAWYARSQGRYVVAELMAQKATRSLEQLLGKEASATLASTTLFATVLLDRGQWTKAERLQVQVMKTSQKKLGVDHPATLTAMANLALTFSNQGRWKDAKELQIQVMETRKTKLGVNHLDTSNAMFNLAATYTHLGQWEEAEKLNIQVIGTRKTKLSIDHPKVLTAIANLATIYTNQGRWKVAEELQVQVIETRKTKLGTDHPDTLTAMANLAATYMHLGRWEEAEELQVQVLETSQKKLGTDHPDTLISMANLSLIFWKQGRLEIAEKLAIQVMETRKTKLGLDHPDTLTSMDNLAWIFWKGRGRYTDAVALMQNCVQARQRVLGPDHPSTRSSVATLKEWNNDDVIIWT